MSKKWQGFGARNWCLLQWSLSSFRLSRKRRWHSTGKLGWVLHTHRVPSHLGCCVWFLMISWMVVITDKLHRMVSIEIWGSPETIKQSHCYTGYTLLTSVNMFRQAAIHATTPASRCLPAKLLALIPGLPGSLQRGAFHFKGSDLARTILTAILASGRHLEHATAIKFYGHIHSDLGTSLPRTLAGGTAISFPSTVEVHNHCVVGKPCHWTTRWQLLLWHTLVDKVGSVDPQGLNTSKATGCTGHSLATLAHIRAQGVLMLDQLRLGFGVKHGIAPISGIARALQDATVVGVRRSAQTIPCLLWFWPRYKLCAVIDVCGAHSAVAVSSIDLHWSNVPHVRRFNELGISIRVSMEWLPRLTAISFWKELGGWDGGVFSLRRWWLINGNPFGCSSMSHWITRCCCNSPQLGVNTCHEGHVVMIICPVYRYRDILLGVHPRMAHWIHHHLVHLVAGDGNDFALKALHDLRRQRLIPLVGPKNLTVVGGNLRCPHIEKLVALGSVVVIKLDVLPQNKCDVSIFIYIYIYIYYYYYYIYIYITHRHTISWQLACDV